MPVKVVFTSAMCLHNCLIQSHNDNGIATFQMTILTAIHLNKGTYKIQDSPHRAASRAQPIPVGWRWLRSQLDLREAPLSHTACTSKHKGSKVSTKYLLIEQVLAYNWVCEEVVQRNAMACTETSSCQTRGKDIWKRSLWSAIWILMRYLQNSELKTPTTFLHWHFQTFLQI